MVIQVITATVEDLHICLHDITVVKVRKVIAKLKNGKARENEILPEMPKTGKRYGKMRARLKNGKRHISSKYQPCRLSQLARNNLDPNEQSLQPYNFGDTFSRSRVNCPPTSWNQKNQNLVDIIKSLYDGFSGCREVCDNQLTDGSVLKRRATQGCIQWPLLFIWTMDW